MIHTGLLMFVLSLLPVLTGLTRYDETPWQIGLLAGAVVTVIWYTNKRRNFNSVVCGISLMALGALGLTTSLATQNIDLFLGLGAGIMGGLFIGAVLLWPQVKPEMLTLAKRERVQWLVNLLGSN